MQTMTQSPMVPGRPLRFSVIRVPFFLEPDYAQDFEETNRERLIRKWGGTAGWEVQKSRHALKERGQEVGIEHFNLDRIASNTMASHRLVQWITRTRGPSASEALYDLLNQRHFVEGRKLNDYQMLAEAAEQTTGVSKADVIAFLESGEGEDKIVAAGQMLRQMGVHSIPTFIVDGRYKVSGAARSDEFVALFRDLERSGDVQGRTIFGETLGVPEHVLDQGIAVEMST
uniref:DSBA-like thioredoxin domain-containing protein n=1 Tax=Hemiselmis tepida TaxID=464990 RepID=A0A7S0VVL2_9CRYP|mmetsp:Transcript_28502/g.72124  ORF Transcript_28502/g.72124 Transcript_28502/m.72124 type:complete len:229 (+) Transcript_28502:157-843(+)